MSHVVPHGKNFMCPPIGIEPQIWHQNPQVSMTMYLEEHGTIIRNPRADSCECGLQ